MTHTTTQYIYQKDVIEFVTVAVQTCLFLEHLNELDKEEFLQKITRLLPLLYLKTAMLEKPEEESDGLLEQFVQEEDYNYIAAGVQNLLGTDDAYLEVFMSDMQYSDEPITAFVSENLADIYQELKNMAAAYQTENESVMHNALLACLEAFCEHWGQKLLNAMRPLHALYINAEQDED